MYYTRAGLNIKEEEREEATPRGYRRSPAFKFGYEKRSRESRARSIPERFQRPAAEHSGLEVLDDMIGSQMRRASPAHGHHESS